MFASARFLVVMTTSSVRTYLSQRRGDFGTRVNLRDVREADHSVDDAFLDDRQPANAFGSHHADRLVDALLGRDVRNVGGHQLGDLRGAGGLAA